MEALRRGRRISSPWRATIARRTLRL